MIKVERSYPNTGVCGSNNNDDDDDDDDVLGDVVLWLMNNNQYTELPRLEIDYCGQYN
jgi:hypothetical protein